MHAHRERIATAEGGRLVHVIASARSRAGGAQRPHSTIVMWPAAWGRQRAKTSTPRRLAFSPDGATLQVHTANGRVRLWHVASGRLLRDAKMTSRETLPFPMPPASVLVQSPSKRPSSVTAKVWASVIKQARKLAESHECNDADCALPYAQALQRVALWPPTGATATADENGLAVSTLSKMIAGKFAAALGFYLGGAYVVAADDDNAVYVCSAKTGACDPKVTGLPSEVDGAALSRDAKLVAASTVDGDLLVARRATGGARAHSYHPSCRIWGLAFSRDSKRLAVVVYDGTILIYRTDKR